jgi:dTDP-4-dehydrorhamnose reductase
MKRLLLLGSTGQLGSQLNNILKNDYDLISISHSDLDFNNFYLIEDLILKKSPDIIINCMAMTDVDKCEEDKKQAYNINGEAIKHIARSLKITESYFINISTDYVFSGDRGNYGETDIAAPVNYYGMSKLIGDTYALSYDNSLTIRTSGVFLSKGFPLFVYNKLKNSEKVYAIPGFYSPISAVYLARAIKKILPLNKTGILNIAGERTSRIALGERIAELFNLSKNIEEKAVEMKAQRPYDSSLNLDKAKKLIDFNFYDLDDNLKSINQNLFN